MWKKVLDIKSRWKKKSYHFENLFSVTCFLQKRPKKSPLFVENAWEQRIQNVYNNAKKKRSQLILKTPLAIFKIQMHRKKQFFYGNVLDLTLFSQDFFFGYIFFRTLFPVILFPDTLLASPILFLGKKSPRNQKLRTLFPVTFCPRTSEDWDFLAKFLFPGYFSETFFPVTFLHRFIKSMQKNEQIILKK